LFQAELDDVATLGDLSGRGTAAVVVANAKLDDVATIVPSIRTSSRGAVMSHVKHGVHPTRPSKARPV
jgi:hypothetical protein